MVQRHHGENPLSRIRERLPILQSLATEHEDDERFDGVTIGISSHLEPKTGVFIETMRQTGAKVLCTANNPNTIHGDVVSHLDAQSGITTFASEGMSESTLDRAHEELLEEDPDVLLTDGGDLLAKLYARPEFSPAGLIGSAEQTTSGVTRARAMATDDVLETPVFAVNHTPMKHWFDNVHGTGESALDNISISTNTVLSGRTVVVAGYGYVGRGVAAKARATGAKTIVTEVDPRKAVRAHMDGHRVMPMSAAAAEGELFITATGNCHVIRSEHVERMVDGAMLCNVGHADFEIAVDQLTALAETVTEPGEGITRYRLPDGREIDLLAEGNLVNLAGPYSQGHPAAVMDSTFGAMFVAARELLAEDPPLAPGVHQLPDRLDREVARRKLDALDLDAWRPDEYHPET